MDIDMDVEEMSEELQELKELLEHKIIPWLAADRKRCMLTFGDNGMVSYQFELFWTESENMPRKAS